MPINDLIDEWNPMNFGSSQSSSTCHIFLTALPSTERRFDDLELELDGYELPAGSIAPRCII